MATLVSCKKFSASRLSSRGILLYIGLVAVEFSGFARGFDFERTRLFSIGCSEKKGRFVSFLFSMGYSVENVCAASSFTASVVTLSYPLQKKNHSLFY